MHRVLVPRLSGVHRFACLALYRALLRQCSPSAGSAPWLIQARVLVKQRFRRYKKLESPSQTANALRAGYEALNLIHSARQGDKHDENCIVALLAEKQSLREKDAAMQREMTKPKPTKPPSPKQVRKLESLRLQEETHRRHPKATSILNRPRPVVKGKRKVPVLVAAREIPILRIKKPQPRNLSGVIRNKLEKRWNRVEIRTRLELELLFAHDEDSWDYLTSSQEPGTWSEAVQSALAEVNNKILESDRKYEELAKKMWQIVLAERELARQEEEQRQSEK